MSRTLAFDQWSAVAAGASFFATLTVVWSYSGMFFNSLLAAFMGAGFFWLCFITMRWFILALKK